MKTIKVPGKSEERLKIVGFGNELPNFRVAEAVELAADRSAAGFEWIQDLDEKDVIELIFDGDIHRWVTVEELEREFQLNLTRGETPGVIEIPPQLPAVSSIPSPSRGAADWALRGLRVLKFDPIRLAASEIASAWDDKLMKSPGLYRLDQSGRQAEETVDQPPIDPSRPVLLFLHGTFSSTKGSFGRLPQEAWKRLHEQYGDQIFAYDHRTLSLSPIQNALDLLDKLPADATLHLVTHSRGGLIGELLCRTGRTDSPKWFDEIDLNLAAEHTGGQGDENELVRLAGKMKAKNISVERFVRIACPARGTTLASGRLDRWLELIVNVLSRVGDPTGALFGVLTDLLLNLKKQAANPKAMPGLAAMVPESGFIRMLNRPEVEVKVDLCVIAGDVEKNDILGRLAIFFADLFYFEDHDLVVQTRAMYGGAHPGNGFYFFHKGTDVNHFHYFANQKTAEKIVDALLLEHAILVDPDTLGKKGFRQLKEAYEGKAVPDLELVPLSFQQRSNIPQPVVYVLPGIMGTHLAIGASLNPIWLNLRALATGGIVDLEISKTEVRPFKLVALAYASLVKYLSATHEVIPFPYDWRLSILQEGERLGREIEKKLKETEQPIRILAHSMGGLVARAMISQRPELWDQIRKRKGSRFVMLGTPNRGAHKIPRLLLGQDQTLHMLALLDVYNPQIRMLEVISRFPGVLQMLPMDDKDWDFLDARTWDRFPTPGKFPWVKPRQQDLDEARRLQEKLNAMVITADDPILYVAGAARGAPVSLEVPGAGQVIFRGTDEGDGTVTWKSGILPELAKGRTWYMPVEHGKMANRSDYFPAIYDLLHEGTTTLLKQEPDVSRGVESPYVLPEEKENPELYPNQADLEQIVLGAEAVPLAAPPLQPVKVSVAHGNLAFCNNPIAVGHYEGDGIFSAERFLDNLLDNRLSARHRLGRYAGPEGSAVVVLNPEARKPGGAIIVGLGKAGDLSLRKLTQAFANALREYAIMAVDNNWVARSNQLAVSTLLIGAGGMGLTVANSVDAILNGVLEANNSLSQVQDSLKNVRIAEIEFVELYKDQAILAARAVRTYQERPEFAVTRRLQSLRGGFERLVYEEAPGWWSRIYVRTDKENSLIFSLPTGRARAEESQQAIQESPIEALVTDAVKNPRWDQKIANTMFELMIPNRLKGSFRDLNNIVLVLDKEAAHYPWELIYDRRAGQDKPLVVQAGLIRQFSTGTFQDRVVDVKNKNVLVVGNPVRTGFANLPGAQQEARLVESKFTKYEFKVASEIESESSAILNSLFAADYRVLHLAGHGVFRHKVKASQDDKDGKDGRERIYTGMVIGKDVFLTANEIGSKLDIPELVFINCCHLGKFDPSEEEKDRAKAKDPAEEEFHKLAASLSQELIQMGVKAVIAAGWAVDDSAALTFADVFYERMLSGYAFGDAVKEARIRTYDLHQQRTNTWAAYQCYGDPSYRLVELSPGSALDGSKFEDIGEAITAIRQLGGQAQTSSVEGPAYLQEKVVRLHKRIEDESPDWLEDSRLQEALGELFGEVYLFDRAIEFYQKALENQNCNASVKTIEQLANFKIRTAVKDLELHPAHYEDSKGIIDEQIGVLKSLMKTLGETAERWALIGSAQKRLALIAADKEPEVCKQALKQMEIAYENAWEQGGRKKLYPLTNHLTARIIRLLRAGDSHRGKAPAVLLDLAAQAAMLAENDKTATRNEFWAGIGCTDVRLLDYLIDSLHPRAAGLSDERARELLEEYTLTWRRYGSSRELSSVIENYDFLTRVLKGRDVSKKLGEMGSALVLLTKR